jgi:hemerythrin
MALFKWRDDLSVGNTLIDNDHRKIVKLVNNLFGAMEQGKSKDDLENILVEIIKFTAEHFKREEEIMQRIQYADLSTHKQNHDKLFKAVLDLREKLIDGKSMLSIEVSKLLRDWAIKHILLDDKRLAAAIRENGLDTSH